MASSIFPDPMQMWREAIDRMEKEANAMGTASLKSPELLRSLQQGSTTMMGLQHAFEKITEEYLRRVNLPSRTEFLNLGESLERIEKKLDMLLVQANGGVPRPQPARTRKPSAAVAPPDEVKTDVEAKPKPARRVAVKKAVAKKAAVKKISTSTSTRKAGTPSATGVTAKKAARTGKA